MAPPVALPPGLDTPRLSLRQLLEEDLPDLVAGFGRPEVVRWLSHVPTPYGPDDAQRWLEATTAWFTSGTHWHMAITPRAGIEPAGDAGPWVGRLIGGINVMREGAFAEIGYWLSPDWWGRGLATEAVAAVARVSLDLFSLDALFATTHVDNEASHRVLLKAGFRHTGIDPDHDFGLRGRQPARLYGLRHDFLLNEEDFR